MLEQSSANFAPFAERMRREHLPEIVIQNFHYYYDLLVTGNTGLIPESEIAPIASAPDITEVRAYAEAGRAAVERAAVLKLNGGLGTSMGLDRAKSLLVARDGQTFLDIIVRQIGIFNQQHQSKVPLILMNSFSTDADTRAALDSNPDLQEYGVSPLMILQNKVPKVLRESLAPAEWPADPELEWCPPGHGELYIVLATSGLLDQLIEQGYEYLFISNSDNLGATLDLGILGYIAEHRIPFLMEVARRSEADKKGGHAARLHSGQLILREIAQCPPEDLPAFQDISRHAFFNTNNIWLSLPRLKQLLAEHNNILELAMIRNAKTLDPTDRQSPGVYQLETAMGSALSLFPDSQLIQVGRDRFVPVKTCNDLLRLRSDIYLLDQQGHLQQHPARHLSATVVELDTHYYALINDFDARFPQGVPSLLRCARLTVEGDVLFEPDLIFEGAVKIRNPTPQQQRLPSGTRLADETHTFDVPAE